MKFRLFITLSCIIFLSSFSKAQTVEIRSFMPLPMDLSASTESRKDNNGNYCALVKIIAPRVDFIVQGNVIGNIEKKGAETWCYLTPGSKSIKIVPTHYEPLTISFEEMGIPSLVSKKTYSLTLAASAQENQEDAKMMAFLETYKNPQNFSLAIEKDGKRFYLSQQEWQDFKNNFGLGGVRRLGVAVVNDHYNFIIALENANGSTKMTWGDAKAKYKLPTQDQGSYICDIKKQLNKALKSYGGEELKDWYWTSDEAFGDYIWLVHKLSGNQFSRSRNKLFHVREVFDL